MLLVEKLKLLNGRVVDLEIKRGEGIVLRGNNGSGKSLLLKSLARLIPATYQGFVYEGKSVEQWAPEEFRSQVLYVSPTPHFLKDMTLSDFFSSVFKLKIYEDCAPAMQIEDYLARWKIPSGSILELSTGQKQLVSLLRAMTLKAKILLLDEPTANLDSEKTREVEELIKKWKDETKGTVILVSHSGEQAGRLGFRTVDFSQFS